MGDTASVFGDLLIAFHIACWISSYPPYQLYKVWLLHLWIFTCGLLVIGLYVTITIKLVVDGKRTSATATSSGYVSIARSMLCFPLVYLITVLPLSIYRIAALRGHRLPDSAILAAGAIFTSSGYVNCTVYAITRNLTEVAFDEHRVSFDGIRFTSNSKSSKVPRAQIESVDDDKVANVELDSLEQWADRPQ
ncbi:hypothetical protein RQP46_003515 [Phenoliferia psychrophenolica]